MRISAFAAVLAVGAVLTSVRADGPSTQPSPQELVNRIRSEQQALQLPSPAEMADAGQRAAAKPAVVPLVTQLIQDIDALSAAVPSMRGQLSDAQSGYEAVLVAIGDEPTVTRLTAAAAGGDSAAAFIAQRTLLAGQWAIAGDSPKAQGKLVDQTAALCQAHPDDTALTVLAAHFSQEAATPELSKRLSDAVASMKNPAAAQAASELASAQKLASLENKPLTLTGKTVNGSDFSSANWKGKVVLVDFWATWCGPCRAELPRVKQIYTDYHAKGLEIIGVSNDFAADALRKFTADESMPWPQLFDPSAAAAQNFHPTSLSLGVNAIPTMFLIDKKGIVRTVEAREKLEEMLPKLLAE